MSELHEDDRLAATATEIIATLRMQRDEARAENERLRRENESMREVLIRVGETDVLRIIDASTHG